MTCAKIGKVDGHFYSCVSLFSISIFILLFIHRSPSGKRPDLQGAMLKKKEVT